MSSVPYESKSIRVVTREKARPITEFYERCRLSIGVFLGSLLGLAMVGLVGAFAISSELACPLIGYGCRRAPLTAEGEASAPAAASIVLVANPTTLVADQEALRNNLRANLKWKAVHECAAEADACGARACFDGFVSEVNAADPHAVDARREQARYAEACRATLAPSAMDGRYLGRSQAACGAKPTTALVEIHGGGVAWRYEYRGSVYLWRGEIDSSGSIRASVNRSPAYVAVGLMTDAERGTTMVYPDCPGGIRIQIVKKIPA